MIVALPTAAPVTMPLFTVATPQSLLDQDTFLFEALLGDTVAVSVSDAPTPRVREFLFRLTPVTATVSLPPGLSFPPPPHETKELS